MEVRETQSYTVVIKYRPSPYGRGSELGVQIFNMVSVPPVANVAAVTPKMKEHENK